MKRLLLALAAVSLVVTACPRTRVATAPTPTRSPRPPAVTIVAQNIRVVPDALRAVRFGFVAAEPSVRIIVTFPDTGAIVSACAVATFETPVPQPVVPQCRRELPSGVREELSSPAGAQAVAIWVGRGDAVTASIRIEYAQGARPRPVRIGLPVIPAPRNPTRCKDNECNPLIEISPVRGGSFSAEARWAGGPARLALLQGRLLAKSFTATGVPYSIPAEDRGASGGRISARMSAPAEYGLVVDGNTADLTDVVLTSSWP